MARQKPGGEVIVRDVSPLMFGIFACALAVWAAEPAQKSVPIRWSHYAEARKGYWDVSARYPVFGGHSTVMALANADFGHWARSSATEFVKQAKADLLPPGGHKPDRGYYAFDLTTEVVYASSTLISLKATLYLDTLGAHPNTVFFEANYGLVHGKAKKLKLAELFGAGADGRGQVSAIVIPMLKGKGAVEAQRPDFALGPMIEQWTIEPDGLRYWFSPYDVSFYAAGPFTAKVKFSSLKELDLTGPLAELVRSKGL